jgi:hypothetical protein
VAADRQQLVDTPRGDVAPETPVDVVEQALGSFTADLRPAARRRRFERSESTPPPARRRMPAEQPTIPMQPQAEPREERRRPDVRATDARAERFATSDAPLRASGLEELRRLVERQHSMLVEMGRLSERVVSSAELAAREQQRADRAEAELAGAKAEVAAMQQRLLAARGLVGQAQDAAHAAAERAAFLEGRCDVLQDTLAQALRGSFLTRWRLRREHA